MYLKKEVIAEKHNINFLKVLQNSLVPFTRKIKPAEFPQINEPPIVAALLLIDIIDTLQQRRQKRIR